jgi:hypothetical protein
MMRFKSFVAVPFQLLYLLCCVALGRDLAAQPPSILGRLLDVSPVTISDSELVYIGTAYLVIHALLFVGTAAYTNRWFVADPARFVTELYAVLLGSSLTALYILFATEIGFTPHLIVMVFGLLALGMCVSYAVSMLFRKAQVSTATMEREDNGLLSAALRTLVSAPSSDCSGRVGDAAFAVCGIQIQSRCRQSDQQRAHVLQQPNIV